MLLNKSPLSIGELKELDDSLKNTFFQKKIELVKIYIDKKLYQKLKTINGLRTKLAHSITGREPGSEKVYIGSRSLFGKIKKTPLTLKFLANVVNLSGSALDQLSEMTKEI